MATFPTAGVRLNKASVPWWHQCLEEFKFDNDGYLCPACFWSKVDVHERVDDTRMHNHVIPPRFLQKTQVLIRIQMRSC